MKDLISIIVPVYNCESFLKDCFDSLSNQSYSNFEVLVIVNGCTDNSEQVCRDYAKNDERFTVITIAEADLSVARNRGLDVAKGEYIAFVDCDDFVSPDYLMHLYNLIIENNAQISMCEYTNVEENCHEGPRDESDEKIEIMSSKEVMDSFFSTHKTSYVTVWNKLYKASLWDDVKYPPARKNEDEHVSYKVLYASNKTVSTTRILYYYRQRSGSIMHTISGKRYCDCMYVYYERTLYFNKHNELDYALKSCISSLKWNTIFYYNICSQDSFASCELKDYFSKNYNFLMEHKDNSIVKALPKLRMTFYKEFLSSPVNAFRLYQKLEFEEYKSNTATSEVIKNQLRSYKNEFRYNVKKKLIFSYIKLNNPLHINKINESLDILTSQDKGICRFGDGELDLMRGHRIGFQKADEKLAKKLSEIINDNNAPCHIAIPDEVNLLDFDNQTMKSRRYWIWNMLQCRKLWLKFCSPSINYLTTNVTRPYMRFFDKANSISYFKRLRTLWDDKDIIIVEGAKSRLGIGNDLFSKSNISRILCPNTDAFDFYDEILEYLMTLPKDKPIFIALGPTATLLAYDLCKAGYRAYDIGHVDIEYEWMNLRTDTKVAIPSKFTNEADGGNQVNDCNDELYLSQIIAKLGISD